jgi:hypothetical protein
MPGCVPAFIPRPKAVLKHTHFKALARNVTG